MIVIIPANLSIPSSINKSGIMHGMVLSHNRLAVDAVNSMCSKRNKSDHSERFPFKLKTMLRHNILW